MPWSSPPLWVAATDVTAAQMNQYVRDNLKAIGDPWGSYTPTLTGFTGTVNRAAYVAAGKWITVHIRVTLTAAPTGTITISLPATAQAALGTGPIVCIGNATGLRQGVGYQIGNVYLASTTTVAIQGYSAALPWNATNPFTWANTDQIGMTLTYEAA